MAYYGLASRKISTSGSSGLASRLRCKGNGAGFCRARTDVDRVLSARVQNLFRRCLSGSVAGEGAWTGLENQSQAWC